MKVGNLVRGHVPIKWGEKVSEKELKKHTFKWYKKENTKQLLTFPQHKYKFEQFFEKETSYTEN